MKSFELSKQLLQAIKLTEVFPGETIRLLAQKPFEELIAELRDETNRRAFWINLYNAFVQVQIVKQRPDLSDFKNRLRFFGMRNIQLAGHQVSLNDIEHGMLRNASIWWSLGYLRKLIPAKFVRQLKVSLDFRIHFTLNCGAASCPAISFYDPAKLDDQLNLAMAAFLDQDATFDEKESALRVSSIFAWYRGDFGGTKGIIRLVSDHLKIERKQIKKLVFNPYDWTLLEKNFYQ